MMGTVVAGHGFHLILDRQFSFFEGDFFELFGIGEVVLFGEFVEAIVQSGGGVRRAPGSARRCAATGSLLPVLPLRSSGTLLSNVDRRVILRRR